MSMFGVVGVGFCSWGVECESLAVNVCAMSMFVVGSWVGFCSWGMKSESLVVNVCFFKVTELRR